MLESLFHLGISNDNFYVELIMLRQMKDDPAEKENKILKYY